MNHRQGRALLRSLNRRERREFVTHGIYVIRHGGKFYSVREDGLPIEHVPYVEPPADFIDFAEAMQSVRQQISDAFALPPELMRQRVPGTFL